MARSQLQAGSLVGEQLGKYEILALLAIGGTAEIYLARIGGEAGFEKYVVVKCLLDHLADDQDYVKMFLDEARLCAQLEHSNIVQTLELGEHKRRYYMAMEYLAGMSLAQLARKSAERVPGGLIPIDLVLGLAAQAAAGLHYAHEKTDTSGNPLNVVHRDVSPQNLVITFDGILKLVDFGIAKAEARQTHTRTGTIKGKFAYMSPEQCQAQEIDRTTDVFALGVIVHELLTGRRLFKRPTSYETYQAITSGKYPAPSQINHRLDPALDDVIMAAVAFKREDRYESAESFGEALLSLLHRRGKSVGAADISRYFDQHFSRELEEHGNRMRQLIEGRVETAEQDNWDIPDDEPETEKPGRSGRNTKPPRPSEAPEGATRVELNPLERVQELHANSVDVPVPADTKERTRPAAGKNGTPRVDAMVASATPQPTQAMRPSGMASIGSEETSDPTAPGRKKRASAMPPIGRAAGDATKDISKSRGQDDATREVGRRKDEETRDMSGKASRPDSEVRPPRLPTSETRDVAMRNNPFTAPTREVQRSHLPSAVSGSGDQPVPDDDSVDEDAATVLNTGDRGSSFPARKPVTPRPGDNVDPLAQTREASRLDPSSFGGPNPGETSTSEKTRPAAQAMAGGASAPPLFGERASGAVPMGAAPAATDAPTQERDSSGAPSPGSSGPFPGPASDSGPGGPGGYGMPPSGADSYGAPPGQGFQPGGPGGGPPPGPNTPPGMSGHTPAGLRTPPGMQQYPSGDYQVPMLESSRQRKGFFDKGNLILAVVFVVSVALGLGATLLLAR